ncbi:MAG: hypothetical protein H7X86_05475, partial [Gorillibacterium sp.]|nr:hypothetical protein [Gorillibacterium sp.]
MGTERMTSYERMKNVLWGGQLDRIPVAEDFWGDVIQKWTQEGHLMDGESLVSHFNLDTDRNGLLNWYVDPGFCNVILEETEDTVLYLDGNGAQLRSHKHHSSTPEHVGFRIVDMKSWEEFAKPQLMQLDRRRVPFEKYRNLRKEMKDQNRFFMSDAWGPFELMQRAIGHETLLLNMALDPDWVKDMVITYANYNVMHWELLFSEEGLPDSTWIAEDLGYKFKPFMSPAMFEDIMLPGYNIMFDYLHSKGLKVVVHSCGFIEPLLPYLIDAGLDCLEAMEYKAGMNMPELFKKYADRIAYFGNIDTRVLESNDIALIEK